MVHNMPHSEESKRKMRESAKRRIGNGITVGFIKGQDSWCKGLRRPEHSEIMKSLYHNGIMTGNKGTKATDERKRKVSESLKKAYSNGTRVLTNEIKEKIRQSNLGQKRSKETTEKCRKAFLGRHHTEEAKRKIGEASKGRVSGMKGKKQSKEWKELMSKKMTGRKFPIELYPNHSLRNKHISKEHKKAISIANTGRIRTDEQREHMSLAKMNPSKEFRDNLRLKLTGRKHTPEAVEKIKEARHKQVFPMYDTKIEVKIQEFLKLLNIEFLAHYYTKEISHAYQCDILIPSTKTIIECDGNYWHGNKLVFPNLSELQLKQKEEDEIRTKELQEKGFRVIRLWENEIDLMDLTKFQEILQ